MSKRNYGYDLIRIFAMLGVFFCHVSQCVSLDGLSNVLTYGSRGVEVFFVLSGYLVVKSIKENCWTDKEFFTRRAKKMLPLYWGTVLTEIIFVKSIHMTYSPDEFKLGWIRYILGIQTWLPASDSIWTNMFALWTMSSFFFFYVCAPFICRLAKSLKSAMVLLVVSFLVQIPCKYLYSVLFSKFAFYTDDMWGISPTAKIWYFMLGGVIYFAIEEKKEKSMLLLSIVVTIAGIVISKSHYTAAGLTALVIILMQMFENNKNDFKIIQSDRSKEIIKFLSKYSFHVYLIHMFAFKLADYIGNEFFHYNENPVEWFIMSLIICAILICWIEMLARIVSRLIK